MSKQVLLANKVIKYFGERKILEIPQLTVYEGEKIGVVGANGAGKTTLLNLLSGELVPDEGTIVRNVPVCYFHQFQTGSGQADARSLRELGLSGKLEHDTLSGGEKTRLALAGMEERALLTFADEPTANLDAQGIEICCQRLEKCETLLLVSHDRSVLDRLCNRILEVRDGKIQMYPGNFSAYCQQREEQQRREWFEYEQYQKEKQRLETAIQRQAQKSGSVKKAPKRMGNSEARLHKRSANESAEKLDNGKRALKSRLERLEVHERPREFPEVAIDFSLTDPPANREVITGSRIQLAYGENRIFDNAFFSLPRGSKTALIGENGAGKTTLMNLIYTGGRGIRVVPKAKIGFFRQGLENLDLEKTVLENVMEDCVQSQQVMRGILARLLIRRDDVFKKAGVLSGGERVKLSFARLFGSQANVLLLDEPTNFLDMPAVEALEEMVRSYPGTVLFVSHDRAFVDHCATRILRIENRKLQSFEGNLTEWEQAQKKPREGRREVDRALLELRITQVIAALSTAQGEDKERLEKEFQELIEQRKKAK